MESGHKSAAGGGAGGDGVLCHACGYQYPNGHPSAKQRRAHRKHCGKPASAAAEEGAGEHDGGELLPGGGGGAAEGIGASAADCGGGLAGSAPEAADAVEGGDNAEQSSGSGAGHQVTEDHLISSSNIPSEITSEASRTDDCTLTAVATQYSEKGSPIEDGDPSEPAVSSEQVEDIPTSVLPPEPEDGAKSSSQACEQEIQNSLHECETQNSTIGPLESNATGGGTSEQMGGVASQVDGIAVTEESKHVLTILFHQMGDDMNTIGKNKFSEDKSVEGVGFDLACQDHLQTEITDKHSTTAVEEASSDKNLNEKILSDETESNQQSKHVLTSSFEKIPDIEVPIESSTEKSVGTDDVLVKLGTDGSHSETPDDVKPQQQPDLTSETAGHLEISEGADGIDEQHYTISEGSIPAISSAFEPAVGGAANIAENVCSSVVTMDDSMQKNVITGTVVTSQVDPLELTTSTMAHEINMVGSTNDVEDKRQNEKGGTDLTSYRGNEMHIIENFEEKQQNKEIIVDPIPHEANAASSTDNHGENEKNEEIIADTSSCKISVVQSMTSAEEKEQIEEFIANLASEETSGTTGRGIVEEMQGEIDVKTSGEIDGACCIETAGENNATTGEVNAGTTADDVEGIIQNEEIATGPIPHGMNMTFSSINEEKMCKEEVTESLDSHENIVVHSTDNVEEKTTEETTADTASHKLSLVASTDSVAERKDGETTADPTLHETSAVHATDNVEKKNEEPILDPATTSATICSMGDVEEKKQSEETTADPSSDERNTLSGTDDAENKKQNGDTSTTGPASDKTEVAQQTTNVVEVEKTEGTASKEISTIESTDDPKGDEEIADKECSMGDVEEKKQSEETTAEPSSDERNTLSGTDNAENRKQNGDTFTIGPASDKTEVAQQTTNVVEETGKTEDTASKEISAIESTDDPKGDEEIADKEMVTDSDKNHVSLKVLLADKNVETKEKEKKTSTKERVLSFRRRSSKDNVSPGKPGSPKASTGQQDWNSPARLPVEKKPKGRKQQWVPFICCSSVQ